MYISGDCLDRRLSLFYNFYKSYVIISYLKIKYRSLFSFGKNYRKKITRKLFNLIYSLFFGSQVLSITLFSIFFLFPLEFDAAN